MKQDPGRRTQGPTLALQDTGSSQAHLSRPSLLMASSDTCSVGGTEPSTAALQHTAPQVGEDLPQFGVGKAANWPLCAYNCLADLHNDGREYGCHATYLQLTAHSWFLS